MFILVLKTGFLIIYLLNIILNTLESLFNKICSERWVINIARSAFISCNLSFLVNCFRLITSGTTS